MRNLLLILVLSTTICAQEYPGNDPFKIPPYNTLNPLRHNAIFHSIVSTYNWQGEDLLLLSKIGAGDFVTFTYPDYRTFEVKLEVVLWGVYEDDPCHIGNDVFLHSPYQIYEHRYQSEYSINSFAIAAPPPDPWKTIAGYFPRMFGYAIDLRPGSTSTLSIDYCTDQYPLRCNRICNDNQPLGSWILVRLVN